MPRWTLAVATVCALAAGGSRTASAQTAAFPAPLPGQMTSQPVSSEPSPFPPVNGSTAAPMQPMQPMNAPQPFPSNGVAPMGQGFSAAPRQAPAGGGAAQDCMKDFLPLKQEAEKRGHYLQALGKRKTKTVQEACNGFTAYSQAEFKMMKFVEKNATRCGIPANVPEQMAAQHKNTVAMQRKVCTMAQQAQNAPRGPAMSLSEALGASPELPEAQPAKRNGGSTFDTLSGNVLAR